VSLNLEGTADTRGNAEYNVQLGLRRTNSIRNALLARGVPEARIGVESSAGATNRFAPDAKESNFRANRTVILTFIRSLAAPAAPPAPAGPVPGP